MEVISVRPLRTASVVWQPKAGAWTFTVVAKLTYDLLGLRAKSGDGG